VSTGIPRTPRAGGPHDPRQDDPDHHEKSAEQEERERVIPGLRAHRGARFSVPRVGAITLPW
jgi:hypothetical protein